MSEVALVSPPNTMFTLIEKLLDKPDFPIEALKELRAMQKEVQAEAAETAFLVDFAHFQGELPSVIRDKRSNTNPYATFDTSMDTVRGPLADNNLSISFTPHAFEDGLEVKAVLSHTMGHKRESTIRLPLDTSGSKSAVQSVGSTMKYGMRYCLISLLAISTYDDGHQGGDNDGSPVTYLDNDKSSALEAAASSFGVSKGRIFGYYSKKLGVNVNKWEALPEDLFDEVIAQIRRMAK